MKHILLLPRLAGGLTSPEIADILFGSSDSGVPSFRGMLIATAGFGLGLWMILKPHAFWKFKFRWQIEYGEPSNAALWSIRISGIVLLLVSVILYFMSLFKN